MQEPNKSKNPQLAKVRAILAKAEHPNTAPEEAETYRVKAFALMAKYGIEQAQLAEEKSTLDQLTDMEYTIDNPWAAERVRLLLRVASAMHCKGILGPRPDGRPGKWAHVFGHESDLQRLEILYASLSMQMIRELKAAEVPQHIRREGRGRSTAWRRSWLLGYGVTVGERLKAAEDLAQEQTPQISGRSTALVLADRHQAAEAAMRARYRGHITTVRTKFTSTGFRDGQAAGARADIGNQRIGGPARGAIES